MTPKRHYHYGRNLVFFAFVASIIAVYYSRDYLLDQYALMTFRPQPKVAAIIDHLQLTPRAKAVLYRAQPQINAKEDFNRNCQTRPHELELGCYYRGRIYVLQIDNPSLASEMDVVMAHELLHAVWAEMGVGDREAYGRELEQAYRGLADKELEQRMADYATTEPGEGTNELHSILATEYPKLSAKLESHYARYFVSRAVVVADHAAYQGVFAGRRAQLEADLATIRNEKAQLAVMNQRMDALKAAGRVAQYNALVPGQNKLVDDINRRIAAYQTAVDEYNALSKSLDSQQITETEAAAQ